eukprot:1002365-Pelagomonas_calceolata.AAC.3
MAYLVQSQEDGKAMERLHGLSSADVMQNACSKAAKNDAFPLAWSTRSCFSFNCFLCPNPERGHHCMRIPESLSQKRLDGPGSNFVIAEGHHCLLGPCPFGQGLPRHL